MLPVADAKAVRGTARRLIKANRWPLAVVVVLHALAAVAALAMPWMIGHFTDLAVAGSAGPAQVTALAAVLAAAFATRAVITRFARYRAIALGERVFAEMREDFMRSVGRLPLSVVEATDTGDILARTTNDIESVAQTVRFGVPRVLVAATTAALTAGAAFFTNPLVALALLTGAPLVGGVVRWYARRAGPVYQRRLASFAVLSGKVAETIEGARTIEALSLGDVQRDKIDAAVAERHTSEWRALWLRSVLFPVATLGFLAPVVLALGWGAHLVQGGAATVGEVAAIALYAMQLSGPIDELIAWTDEIQIGASALARLLGVAQVPSDRGPGRSAPPAGQIEVRAASFAYRPGVDVLHGVDLSLRVGERLAVVGPSGSGKSTLGRLLAGINGPTRGFVGIGDVALTELEAAALRRTVALVTQEAHVFVGSVADNLRLADQAAGDEELSRALEAVGAGEWVRRLPAGINQPIGSGAVQLTPAQAQQLALARLILLDPQTVILDEATSLMDPTSALGLERGLSRILAGRTVVSIAHRLTTARDADRVALLVGGRIIESGSHDELLALGGEYAALWRSWQAKG
ncbi:MAG: ABC transporter ATP-binding protein/permease [Bifidobacteriaceae bacterium]|nr:ABC transporter ATP-binding protein/permease [Bifidobacteriaceae bacterium]